MKLEIIKGAINSPKTSECIKRIEKIREEEPFSKVVFIVPEQFSYAAEKLMTKHFGGTGLNNIEVMTMSQLTNRYLNRARKNYLTDAGKAVLIQKAINEINKEDNVYGGCSEKTGLVNAVSQTITELKKCLITPDMLLECANNCESLMLKRKLLSIADIYSKYRDMYSDKFYDSEEDLTELSYVILNKGIFNDTHIFMDEFSNFYPQHYRVIESILKTAKSLTITLPIDDKNKETSKIPQDTLNRLQKIFIKNNQKCYISNISANNNFFESAEMKFYFENYSDFSLKHFIPYENKTEDIKLYFAKDPYQEVENVAKNIRWLVDEKGYRYKDIAVYIGNTDDYISIIEAVFSQYNIKYFADVKMSIIDHPVILTLISMFDIIKENWSYDSVFRYLKTGYIYKKENDEIQKISDDDIDLLDWYVLKYGVKGKKKWIDDEWGSDSSSISDALSEHQSQSEEEKAEKVNEIRKQIVAPIKRFIEKTSTKNTVVNIATALFEFLQEIHLYEGLSKEIKSLSEIGFINEAQQLSQVWNILMEILDQITTALGDTRCSRDDFKKYIFSGLSVNEISIIPPSLDSVAISSANSVKNNNVNALFIIGAIRGVVPVEKSDEGILSDKDRNELDELLIGQEREMGGNTEQYSESEEYKLYRVLFSSKKLLMVSYPLNNFDGEVQVPSQVIVDLGKIFKNITTYNGIYEDKTELGNFFTVNSALDYLLKNRKNKNDTKVRQIYRWFLENDKEKLDIIKNSDLYKVEKARISPKNAELLYKEMLDYSASRLKVYADCPFEYFIKYGLGAKPQEIWQIQKFDLGTLMHYIICRYCEIIGKESADILELKQRWCELSDIESDKIIEDIISDVAKNIHSSVKKDENKIDYLLMRIKRIIKRSVEIVRLSLTKGEYAAVEYEKNFSVKIENSERNVGIRGTIDRIDIALDNDSANIRVIDYKSGKKDFSVVSVCNMQDVQLVLYATAATELFRMGNIKYSEPSLKSKITGIMYNKLKDSMVDGNDSDEEQIGEKTLKDMQLNGVVVLEESGEELDISNAVMMDRDIGNTGKSSYLNFSLKTDGKPKQSSDIISRKDFEKLTQYVNKKIIDSDIEIMNGNIEILPYSDSNSSACDYCEMKEVCLFDKKRDKTRTLCKNAENAWEIIDKELKK